MRLLVIWDDWGDFASALNRDDIWIAFKLMSKLALESILDEYRAQRRYREAKRNEYLRRFEVLKQSFPHHHHAHSHHASQEAATEPRHHVPVPAELAPERQQHGHEQHSHSHSSH